MSLADLEVFLGLIFPWDDKDKDLFKCITTIYPDRRDPNRNVTINNAVKSYDDLMRLIASHRNWRDANLYVALGTQKLASTEQHRDGFTKAIRRRDNMASFNALFCDVDIGKPNCYQTDEEADKGIADFVKTIGLPQPMIIHSGTGRHVYWPTVEAMPVDQWQQHADALKAAAAQHKFLIDPSITIDAARILRLPTTLNYKTNPPRPVRMLQIGEPSPVAVLTAALAPFMGGQRPGPASEWAQNFTGGMAESLPKPTIDQVAAVCPMTAQTLETGGAGKAEPDWSNDIYLAAWTADPVEAAHRLSLGHAGYNPKATDTKLANKLQAIANNKTLGMPKCELFSHAACATCPLQARKSGPIQLSWSQPVQPSDPTDTLMPPDYVRVDGAVYFNTPLGPAEVLNGYPILDGALDPTTHQLVIKTYAGGEFWGQLNIGKMQPSPLCDALYKDCHIVVTGSEQQKLAQRFIMAWVTHLQQIKRYIKPQRLGWTADGFVFGENLYTPDGAQAIYRGKIELQDFTPTGKAKPWHDAMTLIYGSPSLESAVASAFGGPLVQLFCDYSLVLSIMSYDSGYGKTTAMKTALAVWGDPVRGMSALNDTVNAFMHKISILNHIPIYWDELKTTDQIEKVVDLVFSTSQGRAKARMTQDVKLREIGTSKTLFAVASNHGIIDAVVRSTGGTEAGGLRVFECEVQPTSNRMPDSSDRMLALEDNYGVVGSSYASLIAKHRDAIIEVLKLIRNELHAACNFTSKERFWRDTMVAIEVGARLANTFELATFDVPAIRAYLIQTLARLRHNAMPSTYTLAGEDAGEDVLYAMMTELRGSHMIVTNVVPVKSMGRPLEIRLLQATGEASRLRGIWFQHGSEDGRYLIAVRQFNDWCIKHKHSPEQVLQLLRKRYDIYQRERTSIGAGVSILDGIDKIRTLCWDMTPKPQS